MNTEDDTKPCNSSFFTIIVSPSIQLQYLRVPCAFIDKFGKSLLDHAHLRVPDGTEWKVYLKKHEGQVLFGEGWSEFANHYTLSLGQFMVFKYEGNSKFEVIIFDRAGTEIEYAQKTITMNTETGRGDDSSVGESSAVKRAKAFESSNPHFTVVVRPSYLRPPFNFSVPVWYAKKQMKKDKYNSAILLQVEPTGKTWTVNCHFGQSRDKTKVRWRSFACDNQLEVGDVCVFELMNRKTKTYKVTIFRR